MRETKPKAPSGNPPGQSLSARSAPTNGRGGNNSRSARDRRAELDSADHSRARRPTPAQFDLLVTFADDQSAREALLALRRERFGPNQAVLLTRGPLQADEFELAIDELRAESYLALGIVVATELAIGVLLGGVIGWLVGLFRYGPAVGPVWQPILVIGGIGLISGAVVAFFDVRRWHRVHLPRPGEAAVALRLRGPDAAERLARAQWVLEHLRGQREKG